MTTVERLAPGRAGLPWPGAVQVRRVGQARTAMRTTLHPTQPHRIGDGDAQGSVR
jgi:hypothetical protein